jgi:lysozyme
MNGIDISRYQKGIDLGKVPCDFVIVKSTQGTSFISSQFKIQANSVLEHGKLLGIYHYSGGGGAIPEAKHFLDVVEEYIGKAILCLDWEGEQNPNFLNPEYAKAFLAYIKQETKITPFIYMSKSVCRQYSWDASYPLWCAQYKNQNPTGYQDNPWTDSKGFGAWKDCAILQYSSKGQLPGYYGNLDLDKAYISAEEWQMYARGEIETQPCSEPFPLLKKGDHNEYVRHWQMFLNLNGYACGNADGIFGPKTEAAVKKWQKNHGLKADGIIGPKTWASLPGMA